jgi:hypothetical protein
LLSGGRSLTAVPANPRVSELRELLRHLRAFRAVYEETGMDDIPTPDGTVWSLWDLEYLESQLCRLTLRQRQAITLCLVHNMRERDAAVAMGVSATNPVSMYASLGLQRLLDMVDAGELVRFRENRLGNSALANRHNDSVTVLVKEIESVITKMPGDCWLYPNRSRSEPRLLVRSARSASGFFTVSPLAVLFGAYVGPVPEGTTFAHSTAIPAFSISCVNPHHAVATFPRAYRERIQLLAAHHRAAPLPVVLSPRKLVSV